uniref:C-type lectin domain-containing protein n=1 Tax=Oryzias latipes TaxID=8090 RepID=A0A3P9IF70_ORYLA
MIGESVSRTKAHGFRFSQIGYRPLSYVEINRKQIGYVTKALPQLLLLASVLVKCADLYLFYSCTIDQIYEKSTNVFRRTNQNLFHVCPNMSAECPWCQKSWIQFQRKCYFFSGDEVPLKTWQESRQFCQNVSADLVVIHNQQELVRAETAAGQQFSTGPYYDMFHGYWLGLEKKGNEWVWIDGQRNSLDDPLLYHGFATSRIWIVHCVLHSDWLKSHSASSSRMGPFDEPFITVLQHNRWWHVGV